MKKENRQIFAYIFFGVVLILFVEPSKVLVCIIVYMVVQFVENQFIYPHVVGGSVGLAPLSPIEN